MALINLTMLSLAIQYWAAGEMQNNLELWFNKTLQGYKQSLMDRSGERLEGQSPKEV